MPADAADEIEENVDQQDADHGAAGDEQTHGDPADARQPEDGAQPNEGGDDSDATSDPLVLAHMEPEKAATKPSPTTTTTTKQQPQPAAQDPAKPATNQPPAAKPADKAKQDAPAPADEEVAEREALADLPPEDWQKLTHKGKSQFLAQRKAIRANAQTLKAEREARKQADERYSTVARYVRDNGLGDEEFAQTVAIGGLVKRGDARAIPVLEQQLEALRQHHGIAKPAPAPAAPVLDADLEAILRESEELGIDTSKVRARYKAAPAAQPPAPAAPAAPAPQPTAARAAPATGAQPAFDENVAMLEALVAQGVPEDQVVNHVAGLMAANPALRQVPAGQRLGAVLKAHQAAVSRPAVPQRPAGQPLSGRGRPPMKPRGTTEATSDPLKLAVMPPRGR